MGRGWVWKREGSFGFGADSDDEADSEEGEEVDLLREKEVFERKVCFN